MARAQRVWRLLVALGVITTAVAFIAGPALGQLGVSMKPGELTDAQCYGHHREEGFRSADLFPSEITSVKRGDTFEFQLTMVVPWLHSVLDPFAFVNISGMPGARFPGGEPPLETAFDGTLSPQNAGPAPLPVTPGPATAEHAFAVKENATTIVAQLFGEPGPTGRNAWTLRLVAPNGDTFSSRAYDYRDTATSTDPLHAAALRVPYTNLTQGGPGTWTARVTYAAGTEPSAPYDLGLGVYYNLSASQELLLKGPRVLDKKEQETFRFTIIAPPEGLADASLIYGFKGIAHHLHTDPNAEDYGNYTKWNVMTFPVGESTIIAGQGAIIVPGPDPGPLMRAYGQIIGFASSFLLLPSVFLGGTFGRGSVLFFNKALGGARRRVLWHNATSYLLLATALIHMYLFLIERFWDWSYGIIWGGLSLAAMIGLAFTGAFQRRFVQNWGFARWRFMHFTLGISILGFVLVHIFADGSHLAGLRLWLSGAT